MINQAQGNAQRNKKTADRTMNKDVISNQVNGSASNDWHR